MNRRDVLENIEWGEENFSGLVTSSYVSRRDVMRAVKAGHAKSGGICVLCDGDGFALEPEREREYFVLTDAGRKFLKEAPAI